MFCFDLIDGCLTMVISGVSKKEQDRNRPQDT